MGDTTFIDHVLKAEGHVWLGLSTLVETLHWFWEMEFPLLVDLGCLASRVIPDRAPDSLVVGVSCIEGAVAVVIEPSWVLGLQHPCLGCREEWCQCAY